MSNPKGSMSCSIPTHAIASANEEVEKKLKNPLTTYKKLIGTKCNVFTPTE